MQKSQERIKLYWIVIILSWIVSIAGLIQNSFWWFSEWEIFTGIILLIPAFLFILFWILYLTGVQKSKKLLIAFIGFSIFASFRIIIGAFFLIYVGGWSSWLDQIGALIATPFVITAFIFSIKLMRAEEQS